MLTRSIIPFNAVNAYRINKFFLITLVLFFSSQVNAAPSREVHHLANKLNLGSHPVWYKLLHYNQPDDRSVVLTNDFFLSANGRLNPDQELTATIDAYFKPFNKQDKNHARCRFPARYYWLSQFLPLPGYDSEDIQCFAIKSWGELDNVKSVSLLLVSGYLGNPASTFGHAFLKLNTDLENDPSDLFDATLNYGALVPEDENPFSYAIKGVFGGYDASFSDKYFYTQDLVYSNTEFRDIWEYRLDLSQFQLKLLILHIWEIVGKKFTYYFLTANCAYRLGEMLDLVVDEKLMGDDPSWYFPVELFHMLNEIDEKRLQCGKKKLIQYVRFIPSSQRRLYSKLGMLNSKELDFFNAIIKQGGASIPKYLKQLQEERQIFLLDSLLAYQQYRIITEQPVFNRKNHEMKKQILLARLQRPIREAISSSIPEIDSPANGSPPMEFGIGYSHNSKNTDSLLLTWSPYKKGRVGNNSLQGDELILVDLTVGVNDSELYIDRFDLLSVLNLNTIAVAMECENYLSWELKLGFDRVVDNNDYRYNGVLSFGMGRAWQLTKDLIGYAMVPITLNTVSDPVRLRPHLALRYGIGNFTVWMFGGIESTFNEYAPYGIYGGKINYQINEHCAVHSEFSKESFEKISIGLSWYL